MKRLAEILIMNGCWPMRWHPRSEEQNKHWHKELAECLSKMPCFVVDNVADYFYTGTEQEYWSIDKDFPILAPPFRVFWMEYRQPRQSISKVHGQVDISDRKGWATGAIISAYTREEIEKGEGRTSFFPTEFKEEMRWRLSVQAYQQGGKEEAVGPTGSWQIDLDEAGRPIPITLCGVPYAEGLEHLVPPEYARGMSTQVHPIMLAISFLHCKNVQTKQMEDPHQKKKKKKRGKIGGIKFNVLEIEPMKKVLKTEGRSDEHGISKALHICRGHFKDYRDKGLFGKHKGIFWWEHSIRGSKEKGVVDKVYDVKGPA
jgi:hypothetical protein